jgi:hypothetical protein
MLKIHETIRPDGSLAPIHLGFADGSLAIVSDEGTFALPEGALEAVLARFGAPLDRAEGLIPVGTLDLGDRGILRHVRHLGRWDVIARDYLVLERVSGPGAEASCALATTVAGALQHLGRASRPATLAARSDDLC